MVAEQSQFVVERMDGIVGLGHWIHFAGLEQLSVSWPDITATRHTADDVQRRGYSVRRLRMIDSNQRDNEVHQGEESSELVVPNHEDTLNSSPSVARISETEAIRQYLAKHGIEQPNSDVISGLATMGYEVNASQIQRERKRLRGPAEE
jgi:hypothetical protein